MKEKRDVKVKSGRKKEPQNEGYGLNIDSKQAEKINNRLAPPGSLSKNKEKRRDSGKRRRLLDLMAVRPCMTIVRVVLL